MTPEQAWAEALASVIAGRKPAEVAVAIDVAEETVRRWLRGETVPTWETWHALVCWGMLPERLDEVEAVMAARDAVARSAGRPRKPDAELKEAAERRALGRRKVRE